jgi:hypothetical protein
MLVKLVWNAFEAAREAFAAGIQQRAPFSAPWRIEAVILPSNHQASIPMKKFLLILAVLGLLAVASNESKAQSFSITFGGAPEYYESGYYNRGYCNPGYGHRRVYYRPSYYRGYYYGGLYRRHHRHHHWHDGD